MKGSGNKKILAPLGALLLAVLMLTLSSCGSVKPIKSTAEEAAVIGRIGTRDVRYEELRYLTLNYREELEKAHGTGIWNDPAKAGEYRKELEDLVWGGIVSDYYAVWEMANEYYVGGAGAMFSEDAITDAVQKAIDETAAEAGGKKEYKKGLAGIHMTDSLYRFYITAEECANELFYILYNDLGIIDGSDDAVDAFMHSDKFIRTNHIYLNGLTAENEALAGELRTKLAQSSDPEKEIILLKGRYCADYSMTTTHGIYFARYSSNYGDEYETAAFELAPGGISDVVKTSTGYYVIMRLPVEDDYLIQNYDDFKEDILGSEFNIMLDSYKSKLEFIPNDHGKNIDLLDIK